MISLETRASLVTERADVVLPGLADARAGRHLRELGGPDPPVRRRDPAAERDVRPAGARRPGRRARRRPRLPHRRPRPGPSWTSSASGRATAGQAPDYAAPDWPSRAPADGGDRGRAGHLADCTWTTAGRWTASRTCWPPRRRRSPGSARPRRPRPASADQVVVAQRPRVAHLAGGASIRDMVDGVVWVPEPGPGPRGAAAPGGRRRRPGRPLGRTWSGRAGGGARELARPGGLLQRPLVGGAAQGAVRPGAAAGADPVHHLVRAPRGRASCSTARART